MTEEVKKFTPKISNVQVINKELTFTISGDNNYGFDKSLINAIRRILLTEIPTVGFKLYDNGENNDINMIINNSSLHNEMLLHRISLVPLYINPENFMKNYLFECKVIHDTAEPFKFITTDDINIYPLNSSLSERLEKYNDESKEMTKEDEKLLLDQLNVLSIDNYDLKKPLSQKDKEDIFRPFEFRGVKNHCLITELKTTNTENIHQELHFYGSPSIGYGYEDAKFQAVSQSTYSFTINKDLVESVLDEKIKVEEIDKNDIETYRNKFLLSESERYFYRDNYGEPNCYNFSLKSNHYYDEEILFMKSIKILLEKCENFKLQLIEFLKENDSNISFIKRKEYVYLFEVLNESHTLGNLVQSHIVRRCINNTTIVNNFSYKKPHPLEDKIYFILSVNPKNKFIQKNDELVIKQNIITFVMEAIDEIINDIRILYKISEKTF